LDEELKLACFFSLVLSPGPGAFGFPDKQGWIRKLACLFYLGWMSRAARRVKK